MRSALIIVGCLVGVTTAAAADKPILVLDAGGHTAIVRKVLFSRDGRELITVSDDKTIRIWDTVSGVPVRVLRPPIGAGREGLLVGAALSPDGSTLAVGGIPPGTGVDGIPIYLIGLATDHMDQVLIGHENWVTALSYSPDGSRILSGSKDATARIWDVTTGKSRGILKGHTKPIYGVAFSPDGHQCATASWDHTTAVWEANSGRRLAILSGHTAEVQSVAWSPDGLVLATGSYDQSIRFWKGRAGDAKFELVKTFDKLGENAISSITFAADSHRLLYTEGMGRDQDFAVVLDTVTGNKIARFDQHKDTIHHGAVSPDGTLAATGDGVGEVFLWKTTNGARMHKLVGRGRIPWAVGWSPEGTRIAWGVTNDYVEINSAAPLERTFDFATLEFGSAPSSRYVRARPKGSNLIVVAGPKNSLGNVTSALVRQGGRTLATLQMTDPYDLIKSYTLLPDDRVAVGSSLGLRLYDARTGKYLRQFQGHTGVVWAVSPSPDGRYLLSAAGDMTLRIWQPDRDEPLLSCFFAGDDWIVWTPEGYYAASPGGESLMGWHVNNGRDQLASYYPARQFRSTLYRPDVIKLLLKAGSVERALELADAARGRMTEKTEVANVLPPKVRITAPQRPSKERTVSLKTAEVEIRATATSVGSHPVTMLRLLLDDRPYQGQKGIQTITAPKPGDVSGTWQVTLDPGRHTLKVLADSAVSQGISESVEMVYVGNEEEPVRLPKLYVVAIGVTDYPGDLKLNYAAKDALALTNALKSHSKPLFREIEVQTITDAKATRGAVLKSLNWLRTEMTQNDYGIFFFAGHGELDNDGMLYFLPVDADLQDLVSSAVLAEQVKRVLSGVPGKLITILDACHSGGIEGSKTGKRRTERTSLTDDLVRELVTDENGVVAMCSSTGREFSLENNQFRQGTFTLAIIEGLSGKADFNKDGTVFLNELDAYVTDRVKELTRGQQHPVTAKPGSIRSFPLAKP